MTTKTNQPVSDQEHHLRTLIETLERENAALREKVDDWENAVAHALDHRSDEQHCTCVAPLVGKVQQLERENIVLHATLSVFEAVSKEAQS
jgi:exonuclease VII small subunit